MQNNSCTARNNALFSKMKPIQLCHTVTKNGHFYFIEGRKVCRDEFLLAKFQRRQDCFITRVTKNAVRNFSTVYAA